MTSRLSRRWLPAGGAAGASLLAGGAVASSTRLGLIGLAGAILLCVLWVIPRRYLGAAALALYALVPVKFLPYPGDPGAVSPAIAVVCIWAVRRALAESDSGVARESQTNRRRVLAIVIGCGLVVIASVGANHADHLATTWSLNYLLLVLAPVLLMVADPSAKEPLIRAWMALSVALGAFAVAEAFIWHSNPVFGGLYASARVPLLQTWDVYRVTTSLGHPLVNGTFFAGGVVIAAGCLLQRRTMGAVVTLAMSTIGLFVTASRGPAVGAAVGVIALLTLSWGRRDIRTTRAIAALGAVVAAVAFAATGLAAKAPLLARSQSSEAQSSLLYRQQSFVDGVRLAQSHPLFGWGPGHADATLRAAQGRHSGPGVENGWIELLVGMGIAGFALAVCLTALAIVTAFRYADGVSGALVLALLIAIASFNFFEGQWPSMIMVGLALGCALSTTSPMTKPRV